MSTNQGIGSQILAFYRFRIFKRELSLLTAYHRYGRLPRLIYAAYWRASTSLLLVPVLFFFLRIIDAPEGAATAFALLFFAGLLFADVRMFITNAGGWYFANAIFNWPTLMNARRTLIGPDQGPRLKTQGQDRVKPGGQPPKGFMQAMAKSYLAMRTTSPALPELLNRGTELRTLLFVCLTYAGASILTPDFIGYIVPVLIFITALQLKRLKAIADFWLTWPEMRKFVNWEEVERLARGGV